MSAIERPPAGGAPGGVPAPVDLVALEQTRQGLELAAPGVLLVLFSVPWIEALQVPDLLVSLVRMLGWLLLGLGLIVTAPTPDGPLPRWLKLPFAAACLLAALQAGLGATGWLPRMPALAPYLVRGGQLAFLLLPWILWRFCQQRGLTGRALSWLWGALALLAASGLYLYSDATWPLWLFPALAVTLFLITRQTARDLWLDALHKASRRSTAQRTA